MKIQSVTLKKFQSFSSLQIENIPPTTKLIISRSNQRNDVKGDYKFNSYVADNYINTTVVCH